MILGCTELPLIISQKDLKLKKYEKELERKIHSTIVNSLNELDEEVKKNILNGWIIEGWI